MSDGGRRPGQSGARDPRSPAELRESHAAGVPDPDAPARAQRFATLIREETGNALPPSRLPSLEPLIARRAIATGRSEDQYLDDLASGRLPAEWAIIVAEVTIKESSFYRAPQQFEAIVRQVLPSLLPARAASRRLRLWSVACASGEEPATLALLCAEHASLQGWDWQVLATDLDAEALDRGRRGFYGERAVAGVPEELRRRWFTRRGSLYELAPALRERIVFHELNLVRSPWSLPDACYDVILARNVLIYFRRALQRRVLEAVAGRMAVDGFLFLGASETLWQAQGELEVIDLGGVFCYRHSAGETGDRPVLPRAARALPRAAPAQMGRAVPASAPAVPFSAPRAAPNAAPAAPLPPVGLLAQAVSAFAEQRFAAAEEAIGRAVAETPQDAVAHAVRGLLLQVLGRPAEAVAAYRAALYLDPTLFQARVQLAEALTAQGQPDRAEQQWREVVHELGGGAARPIHGAEGLPWIDRARALARARQALRDEGPQRR